MRFSGQLSLSNDLKAFIISHLKPKFYLTKKMKIKPKRVLDIGIENNSYAECKLLYPDSVYHGLDQVDASLTMDSGDIFFLKNLENTDSLKGIGFSYDLIIANHVIEHIDRGEDVFGELCDLLSKDGVLYVEMPSIRSAFRRKRKGSYHFHDDPTHRKFYSLELLANIAMTHHCEVVSCGPVSTWLKDLLSLPRASIAFLRGRGWGPYLLHMSRKVDHIMVVRKHTSGA